MTIEKQTTFKPLDLPAINKERLVPVASPAPAGSPVPVEDPVEAPC